MELTTHREGQVMSNNWEVNGLEQGNYRKMKKLKQINK